MRKLHPLHLFRSLSCAPAGPCALAIGNFDGVHIGHQALLRLLCQEAGARGLIPSVLTFEPHPRVFFSQTPAPWRISTLRDKLCALAHAGIHQVGLLPFNAQMARLTATEFVEKILCQALQARLLLVGDDFHFGAGRAGNYALLAELAPRYGFEVLRMATQADIFLDGVAQSTATSVLLPSLRVSSSAVRQALAEGRMADAARLLGRPYSITAHVVHGQKRGRVLGFPTLNLPLRQGPLVCNGIFAVRVLNGGNGGNEGLLPAHHPGLLGVASLGFHPTVEGAGRQSLEVHCLEWPSELGLGLDSGYGQLVEVQLHQKLRDEALYSSLVELQKAIQHDVDVSRGFWKRHHVLSKPTV